jgi:adenine-specific DNA-methyltransferase
MNDKEIFLSKQIITYMGNKRKILPILENIIVDLKNEIREKYNKKDIITGDGFSGSGIVSRLLKIHSSKLYVNDNSSYSKTLNECFLSNIDNQFSKKIKEHIEHANFYVDNIEEDIPQFIGKHWTTKDRLYYTRENGKRIDKYRYFINILEPRFRPFLLAPLLVEASIHNNTGGHFSGFYKKDGIGNLGGKNNNDLKRITKPIKLEFPVLYNNNCKVVVERKDTNNWINDIPEVDIMYYDPPYNKHPYSIYYFMLELINNWDTDLEIPNTLRGQPKNWEKSKYNSLKYANECFEDLIMNTKAKYIIISYNNDGLISKKDMKKILEKKGDVELIELDHKIYNRLKGMANYKREKPNKIIKEYVWIVRTSII